MKPLPPLLLFVLLVWSTSPGCGKDDLKATDGGPRIDGAIGQADAAPAPVTCSFDNCDGCCEGNTCNTEASANKCGLGGQACQTCENGAECFSGTCAMPTTDCSDCDGCCLGGTQCLEGNVASACGALGDDCVTCADGEGCDGIGECVAIVCDDTNCAGCCTANGECISTQVQNVFECGKDGNACGTCSDEAIECVSGVCIEDQPCLEFCTEGCCTAQGQCIQYGEQDSATCGMETCASCTGDDSCLEGMCTPDQAWTITVNSAIVSAVDENGSAWDTFSGLPDPYVTGALTDDFIVDWATATIDNTLTPNWDEEEDSYLESDLITQGLEFNVLDSDFASFETIGNCVMTITLADLMNGTKTLATCGDLVTNLVIDFAPQ